MSAILDRAADFIYTHARLLERLLFDVRFGSATPGRVGQLVRAYQNSDGGLGYALEPDVRCSESQPLFVEIGLQALCDAGLREPVLSSTLCDYLDRVALPSGLVPILLPSAFEHPRAAHWQSAWEPGLNPTASLCGLLIWQGIDHSWMERATSACCDLLRTSNQPDAHDLLCAVRFVENLPDERLADELTAVIAAKLPGAPMFIATAPGEGYGLTPLEYASTPKSRWRALFTEDQIAAHLDHLESSQQPDGGWQIAWEPPGSASVSEWRARNTLKAVTTLAAYGRI